jgi:outer membrane protein OmpA-like peptidoglycan-associated protein
VQLAKKRADSVRGFLVSNGVSPDSVSAQGFGKADPVADNATASGRKLSRRLDMVVTGDVIGTQISPSIVPPPESANR